MAEIVANIPEKYLLELEQLDDEQAMQELERIIQQELPTAVLESQRSENPSLSPQASPARAQARNQAMPSPAKSGQVSYQDLDDYQQQRKARPFLGQPKSPSPTQAKYD